MALKVSLQAALRHWRVPVLFFLLSFAYELLMSRLPVFFPLPGVILVSAVMIPFFVVAMLAFTYVLSLRALDLEGEDGRSPD